jgi:hypothetical protein
MSFQNLVRYKVGDQVHYGDLEDASTGSYLIHRLAGSIDDGFTRTGDSDTVENVRPPNLIT